MQHWIYLGLAISFEVAGIVSMKESQGFSRVLPSVLMFVFYAASFTALTFAIRKIDISVAYATWAGLGMALITIIGFGFYREPVTMLKIASILMIIAGVVGLKLSTTAA